MNENKDVLRDMDDHWTKDNLESLKKACELMIEKLYPGVISPLVETEDIAGSYIDNGVPYAPSATVPYITWCLHKYPPFLLDLDESLRYKSFKISGLELFEEVELPVDVFENLIPEVLKSITKALRPSYIESFGSFNPIVQLSLIQELSELVSGLKLSESEVFNSVYQEKINSWKEEKQNTLEEALNEVAANIQISHIEATTDFNILFEQFYKDFSLEGFQYGEVAERVIRYRFLLHILIIFLKVAGYERGASYTASQIDKYRRKVDGEDSALYSSIRKRVKSTKMHNTIPKGRELESIRSTAEKLFEKIYGRTKNYDLLIYLDALTNATEESFCLEGRLTTKVNVPVRTFIKSLTTFICFYNYDYFMVCAVILTKDEFRQMYNDFISKTDLFVERLVGVFFHDVAKENYDNVNTASVYIKENNAEIYEQMLLKATLYKDLDELQSSLSSEVGKATLRDDRVFNHALMLCKKGVSQNPKLIEAVSKLLRNQSNLEDKVKLCRAMLLKASGTAFWDDDLYSCIGTIDGTQANVEVSHFKMTELSERALEAVMREANNILKLHINTIRQSI